ncbi:MAG: hypothetical protein KatS3mg040_0039 [Candidatus Kapaibacterium sp.]|nr:MAG: hypothetical protein KatS3mg040_0039 [Candidatus Kapabacteria bacterium]
MHSPPVLICWLPFAEDACQRRRTQDATCYWPLTTRYSPRAARCSRNNSAPPGIRHTPCHRSPRNGKGRLHKCVIAPQLGKVCARLQHRKRKTTRPFWEQASIELADKLPSEVVDLHLN